jgi:choline dehydrogenase-like flavoprotein
MRALFEKLEDCHYRAPYRFLSHLGFNPSRHGFDGGWLQTEKAIPVEALGDRELVETLVESATEALRDLGHPGRWLTGLLQSQLDPNDWRLVQENAEGLRFTPLATRNHTRIGTREYVKQVAKDYPDKLIIELNALATRVLLDDQHRAYGVEYLKGEKLYRAHAAPSSAPGEKRIAKARREVILSGGAYNTPQLLMLSGIGPKSELAKHGIEVKVDLPGVGRNLQDRYEVGVVNRMKTDWKVLDGSTYSPGDPQYREWEAKRSGVYTTNGAVLAVVRKSAPERPLPDLFLFALLGKFLGYFPGYSEDLLKTHNYLTWAILKAHTINTAGTVTLRSADPRDPPEINFRYFEEGNDANGDDLESVVDGIELVRKMTAQMADIIAEEELPGARLKTRDELRQFVKDQAWGHHASCTCKIGNEDDRMAVLDGNFRVYGTQGLRVVDASVFPKIPGFFIVSAVYMISEKASQVILADAAKTKIAAAAPARAPAEKAAAATSTVKP